MSHQAQADQTPVCCWWCKRQTPIIALVFKVKGYLKLLVASRFYSTATRSANGHWLHHMETKLAACSRVNWLAPIYDPRADEQQEWLAKTVLVIVVVDCDCKTRTLTTTWDFRKWPITNTADGNRVFVTGRCQNWCRPHDHDAQRARVAIAIQIKIDRWMRVCAGSRCWTSAWMFIRSPCQDYGHHRTTSSDSSWMS